MHGINWKDETLDNSGLASIIHQHSAPTTEHFSEGVKNCKILSPYLCKDVENLDDLGCPKAYKLLLNCDAEWNCSNYAFRHKKNLHCAEKKAQVYGIWTLNFFGNI